jgi:hypothetical protein
VRRFAPHCTAGRFSMQVTYNGIPVAGSPFLLYVGPFVVMLARVDEGVTAEKNGSPADNIRALTPVEPMCYAVVVCRAEDVDAAALVVHMLLHSQAPADIVVLVTKHVRPIFPFGELCAQHSDCAHLSGREPFRASDRSARTDGPCRKGSRVGLRCAAGASNGPLDALTGWPHFRMARCCGRGESAR